MIYRSAKMGRLLEAYRLLKKSLFQTKAQAERTWQSFQYLAAQFNLQAEKNILELGAGSRMGLMLLFDGSCKVAGVDLLESKKGWVWFKSTMRKICFDPIYFAHLKKFNNGTFNARTVIQADAARTPFPSEHFDFVYSRYLFEHVVNLNEIVAEIFRLLRTGGTTFHWVAPFTALDGGHSLNYRSYPPWQHLLSEVPANVFINKKRINEYLDTFNERFGVQNVCLCCNASDEAISRLTPARLEELSRAGYSKDELLVGSMTIMAQKVE
jgi:SAM-dependent methyltransferase